MNIFDPLISGSLSVSGSGRISGDLTVLGTINATISGTTSDAISASHAASYTLTSSFHQHTNSFNTFTSSYTTGSFTGSFIGDGGELYNIPASGVTGLNLSQISDGSVTASLSQANGFLINTNTEITGNLTVTGRLTAQEYHTELVSASIIYESGSTKFGDSLDDTHEITGSVDVSGSLEVNNLSIGGDRLVNISVSDAGGKYYIDNVKNPILTLIKGYTYKFLFPNIGSHPLKFSTTNDGTHNGGSIYTTGVTTGATPDYIQIEVTDSTPSTLYYFCTIHHDMGNSISVLSDILNLEADRNIVYIEPSRIATTGSNTFIGTEVVSGSLSVTGSVNITGSITLNGQAIGTGKLDEITFQSYTSSNDSRVSSIETSTGSLNSFTNSIDTTIKTKMNNDGVVSGSIQIDITGTTGFSTLSSSIATTDSNQEYRLNSIETSTGSLNTFSSSANGRLNSLETASGSIRTDFNSYTSSNDSTNSTQNNRLTSLESSTSSLNTFTASTAGSLTSLEIASGSINTFTSSATSRLSSLETFSGSIRTDFNSYTSSNDSTNSTQNDRLTAIETATSSLNTFTSSINTTIKSKLDDDGVISGSIQVNITGTTEYSTFSSSIATTTSGLSSSIGSLSSSITATTSGLSSSIGSLSSSVATTTSNLSSSIAITTSGLTSTITSTITSLSSSVATTTSELSSSIGSLSSSVATTTLGTKNRVDSIESKTGSYATTGSNTFIGTQIVTGSLYITQDLIVGGSSSINFVSQSTLNIGTNLITVNAQNPGIRFGGLAVIDSGSSPTVSGSMLFDSINDQWLFVHQAIVGSPLTSSVILMGPQSYDSLGSELYPTINRIIKSVNAEHLGDSNITDTGTKVSINSNTEVTGTLKVTGNITSPNITAIETSTSSLNTFTSSLLTAVELTGSNLTIRGNLLVKGTTTNVNTSTLDVDNNLINLNGTGATLAGLRVKDTTAPNQVSGSLLWDATNDYWIGGQLGSEQRLVRETEFNNSVTRIGNIETSTGSLNSFTSSINTTIKNRLDAAAVVSGSIQITHDSTTGYVANRHIDHSSVFISTSVGSGLTGGGDITTTRNLSIATGGVTNTMLAGSIANDKLSNSSLTIGTTTISLGGTGTTLSGLTSITSTALTGSLQGSISGNAATVTTNANLTGVVTSTGNTTTIANGNITNAMLANSSFFVGTTSISLGRTSALQTLNGVAIDGNAGTVTNGVYLNTDQTITGLKTLQQQSDNIAVILDSTNTAHATRFRYRKNGTDYWSLDARGSGENDALNLYRYYSGNWYQVVSWNHSNGDATFSGAISASNLSGTNTGDETRTRINALAITTVGTITGGTWNGSSISTTYTDAKVTSVTGTTNQVSVSANTGAITLSLPQNIHTSATPTFGGMILSGTGTGNSPTLRINNSSSASFIHSIESIGANMTAGQTNILVVGASGSTKNSGYIGYNWAGAGSNSNYVSIGHWGADHLLRVYGDGTVYMGTVTTGTWQGSSISTTYTDAKVTSVTGTANQVIASSTTGAITLSLPQNIHTSATPTFAGLTVNGGATTATFRNTTASSNSNVCMGNDASANGTGIALLGSTFSSSGQYRANGGYIYSNLAGGLTLHAEGANSMYLATNGTAAITINSSQVVTFANTITGSVSGNAGTVTNGVYTTGDQTIAGTKTFSGQIRFGSSTRQMITLWGNDIYGIGVQSDTMYFRTDTRFSWFRDGVHSDTENTAGAGGVVAMTLDGSSNLSVTGTITASGGRRVAMSNSTTFSNVSSVSFTHNLGTENLTAQVFDSSNNMFFPSEINITSTTVTLTFATNRTGRLVVTG
jgi:hypothetical protein